MKKLYRVVADIGRPFCLVWLGQTISLFGSLLMQFALSIWVFQQTGSVLDFSVLILCAIAFVALFAAGLAEGCSSALWMRKAPPRFQGSLFAMIGALATGCATLVILSGGVLVDRLFEPALAPGGAWELTVGLWFAAGKGRGVALLFVICGGLGFLASVISLTYTQLRRLDLVVPDISAPAGASFKSSTGDQP